MSHPDHPNLGFTRGDVVVVTGAGGGIGKSVAQAASQLGLDVVVWDINAEAATKTCREIEEAGGRALPVVADIGDRGAAEQAIDRAHGLGVVRYLVNNAGPASADKALSFDEGLHGAVCGLNVVTTAWLRGDVPTDASVVNVASVAGNVIGTDSDWYCAAKAAIAGYTRHLATAHAGQLRANAVAPGLIDTPRVAAFAESPLGKRIVSRVPTGRCGDPAEVAWPILFLLSPLASYINGVVLTVDGGWTITQ